MYSNNPNNSIYTPFKSNLVEFNCDNINFGFPVSKVKGALNWKVLKLNPPS